MNATSKKGRVRWDEVNLSENEQVKKEINATAIEEPKTPFHSPCASAADLAELGMDVESYQTRLDEEMIQAGLTESKEKPSEMPSSSPKQNGLRRVSFDQAVLNEATDKKDNAEFEKLRKQHYTMKSALQKGKDLLDEEKEEENGTAA